MASDAVLVGGLQAKYRKVISYHGYTQSLLVSALQKYIRRGESEKASWCALELLRFATLLEPAVFQAYCRLYPDRNPWLSNRETGKHPPHPKSLIQGVLTNLKNRLLVIAVEDVGIGQPGIVHVITGLLAEWETSSRRDTGKILTAVHLLAAAPKLRLLSDLKSVYHLPPYYGKSSAEEERIQVYIGHLRAHYAILEESGTETIETPNSSIFYWVARHSGEIKKNHAIWAVLKPRFPPELYPEWAALKKLYESTKLKETPLFLYQAIVLSILPVKLMPMRLESPAPVSIDVRLDIDDFCNDKHVQQSGETSVTRFALEGALCANELPHVYPGLRDLYIHLKKALDVNRTLSREELLTIANQVGWRRKRPSPAPAGSVSKKRRTVLEAAERAEGKESDYTNPVRTQVTTSNSKTDVLFANAPDGTFVCLKGPLASRKGAENALAMNTWKGTHGLPFMPSLRIVSLLTDRWASTPLGFRNKVQGAVAPFLVCASTLPEAVVRQNLTTYGELKGVMAGKWSPDTILVDWRKIPSHIVVKDLIKNGKEMRDYVLLLLARWIFGISDLADRNFLRAEGRVFSVDEEYRGRPVNFMSELRKGKCELIRTWLAEHYTEHIRPALQTWPEAPGFFLVREQCIALFGEHAPGTM